MPFWNFDRPPYNLVIPDGTGHTVRQRIDIIKKRTDLSKNTRNKMINTLLAFLEDGFKGYS